MACDVRKGIVEDIQVNLSFKKEKIIKMSQKWLETFMVVSTNQRPSFIWIAACLLLVFPIVSDSILREYKVGKMKLYGPYRVHGQKVPK